MHYPAYAFCASWAQMGTEVGTEVPDPFGGNMRKTGQNRRNGDGGTCPHFPDTFCRQNGEGVCENKLKYLFFG